MGPLITIKGRHQEHSIPFPCVTWCPYILGPLISLRGRHREHSIPLHVTTHFISPFHSIVWHYMASTHGGSSDHSQRAPRGASLDDSKASRRGHEQMKNRRRLTLVFWASSSLLTPSATSFRIRQSQQLHDSIMCGRKRRPRAAQLTHGRSHSSLHVLPTGQTGVLLQVGFVLCSSLFDS